jgi:hypothetical protein
MASMRNLLLIAHVFAAVLFLGPSTVATSAFPRYADPEGYPVAVALHRISRGYGTGSIAVALIGIVMAIQQGRFGELWVDISLTLFVLATALLLAVVVPAEAAVLRRLDGEGQGPPDVRSLVMRIRAGAGTYALVWAAILVLMITKP